MTFFANLSGANETPPTGSPPDRGCRHRGAGVPRGRWLSRVPSGSDVRDLHLRSLGSDAAFDLQSGLCRLVCRRAPTGRGGAYRGDRRRTDILYVASPISFHFHSVVVHEHHRPVFADLRDCLTQACREVEAVARPITGKILCATVDGASRLDETGKPMPMKGAKRKPSYSARARSFCSILISSSTASSRVGFSPAWRHRSNFHNEAFREIQCSLQVELDGPEAEGTK